MTDLLPQFGNLGFTLLAFVVALSVIVAVHEYGHYIVGRWTGIHAEVFSLGFGPVLASGVDRHGTRWQVSALPLGGYVKFLGDANPASMGGAEDAVAPRDRRRTMMGAPLWARAATVAAGPLFNFALSLLVFAALFMAQGRPVEPLTVERVVPLPPAYGQELRPGDEVIAIGGLPVAGDPARAVEALAPAVTVPYLVRRDGAEVEVEGPFPQAPVVASVSPGGAAWDVGLRAGDVVTAVDGAPLLAFAGLSEAVQASGGRALLLDVWREGEEIAVTVVPRRQDLPLAEGGFETRLLLGVTSGGVIEARTERLGPGEAARDAGAQLWFIIASSLSGLWHMLTGAISTCNLSGPVGIAEASGAMAAQGAQSFVWFVAVLSAAVGLMNLFPIPVLDGGHLVFHAWEAVTGRPPGDRALRVLMAAGLSIILSLMLFAVANDLFLC